MPLINNLSSLNVNDLSIRSLLKTSATRITSDLLDSITDKKGQKAEENNLIQRVSDLFKEFLLQKYDSKYHGIISRHWTTILDQALFNAELSRSDLLVCHCARRVLKNLEDVIYHIESEGFYPYKGKKGIDEHPIKNFLNFILHPISFNRKLLTLDNLKAIFWRKDPILFQQIREELKNILKNINSKFSTSFLSNLLPEFRVPFFSKKTFSNDFLADSLIEQILCLYSFVEPTKGETLEIPIRKNGRLKTSKYEVEKIMLAPKWIGGPIEAFALTPQKKGFPPILIFRGTPPNPTADGSFFASLTDYTPGFSVGETLYKVGKKQLHDWMAKTKSRYPNEKVKVLGHSLGGSLTYHFAKDFPASTEVSAYDPAGLFTRNLSDSMKGKTFMHPSDIVSMLNFHPTSLDMIKVIPDVKRNFYLAHMRPYGFEPTIFLKVNSAAENKRLTRKVMLVFHSIYSVPSFFYNALYLLIMISINKISKFIKPPILKKIKSSFIKS